VAEPVRTMDVGCHSGVAAALLMASKHGLGRCIDDQAWQMSGMAPTFATRVAQPVRLHSRSVVRYRASHPS
jgi:hypothetical protein